MDTTPRGPAWGGRPSTEHDGWTRARFSVRCFRLVVHRLLTSICASCCCVGVCAAPDCLCCYRERACMQRGLVSFGCIAGAILQWVRSVRVQRSRWNGKATTWSWLPTTTQLAVYCRQTGWTRQGLAARAWRPRRKVPCCVHGWTTNGSFTGMVSSTCGGSNASKTPVQ